MPGLLLPGGLEMKRKWGGNAVQNPELRAPGPLRLLQGAGLEHPPNLLFQASSFFTQSTSLCPSKVLCPPVSLKPAFTANKCPISRFSTKSPDWA